MPLLERAYAALYDPVVQGLERAGLARRRHELLADVGGHVVEIGAGTGANLRHLGPDVERVSLFEPSRPMADRLRARVRQDGPGSAPVEVIEAPAEALPLADGEADVVVSTLVLCSVDDLDRALAEIRRVLAPDGRLVLIEHVRGTGAIERVQRAVEPIWSRLAIGCRLTSETRARVAAAGFDVGEVEDWRLPGAGPASPAIAGVARPT